MKLEHFRDGRWHTVSVFHASARSVAMALAERAVERTKGRLRFAMKVRGVRYELVNESGTVQWLSARGKRFVEER